MSNDRSFHEQDARIRAAYPDLDVGQIGMDEDKLKELQTKFGIRLQILDQMLRNREIRLKEQASKRDRWANPLTVGVLAGALGLAGNFVNGLWANLNQGVQLQNQAETEKIKLQNDLMKEAIKPSTVEERAKSLVFFANNHLIRLDAEVVKSLEVIAGGAKPVPGSTAITASARSEWSGQSGASGDPRTSADGIRAAAENFPKCIEEMRREAAAAGISRQTYDEQTADLKPDLRIMDLSDGPIPDERTVWEYFDSLVSPARVARGRELLKVHHLAFDAVERRYGTDRFVLAAMWGVETNFGIQSGEQPVVRSTATQSCVGRRQEFFRKEFLAALEMVQKGDVDPTKFLGSWAGAFGPFQMMPTTFKRYAVDLDGDGRRDVLGSVPDMLATAGNLLNKSSWTTGKKIFHLAIFPKSFDFSLADRSRSLTINQWESLGIQIINRDSSLGPDESAVLWSPSGARGPSFLLPHNFRALLRVNPSAQYALAIGLLAHGLETGTILVLDWPRNERALSLTERTELQQMLAKRGYAVSDRKGQFGMSERTALMQFQSSVGMTADGYPTVAVLERLRDL